MLEDSMEYIIDKDNKNITIKDSYKYADLETQVATIKIFLTSYEWFNARSLKSYVREWRAHNRLYKLGLFKSHTKDVDLNVNESIFRRILYFFLGF